MVVERYAIRMITIPAVDIMGGKCVRLTRGERDTRKVYDEDPVSVARGWAEAGAKRIHVVDLDGAFEGESRNPEVIERLIKAVDVPIEIGGGIRSAEAVERWLGLGAAYVVIGTVAVEDPQLASEIVESHPGKIYIGIDTRAGAVATRGWITTTDRTHFELAERAAEWKARGVIFTAIERDGELVGPDFDEIEDLAAVCRVPIIASGGVTRLSDLQRLAKIARVEGAIVGKALYEGTISIDDAMKL